MRAETACLKSMVTGGPDQPPALSPAAGERDCSRRDQEVMYTEPALETQMEIPDKEGQQANEPT